MALFPAVAVVVAALCVFGFSLAGRPPNELAGVGAEHAPLPPPVASARAPKILAAEPADTAAFVLKPLFNGLDCEGQGIIRANEVDEHIAQVLSVYNRDSTRTITRGEYLRSTAGALRERRAALFAAIDQNQDDILSAKEFARHVVAMIEQADTNRDGEVTREELEQRL